MLRHTQLTVCSYSIAASTAAARPPSRMGWAPPNPRTGKNGARDQPPLTMLRPINGASELDQTRRLTERARPAV